MRSALGMTDPANQSEELTGQAANSRAGSSVKATTPNKFSWLFVTFVVKKNDRLENFGGGIILIDVSGAAGVAQLVERHLAKVVVDGSSPFARST